MSDIYYKLLKLAQIHSPICISVQDFYDSIYNLIPGPGKLEISLMGMLGDKKLYIAEHVPQGCVKVSIRKFPSGNVIKDWSMAIPFDQIDNIDRYLKLKYFW